MKLGPDSYILNGCFRPEADIQRGPKKVSPWAQATQLVRRGLWFEAMPERQSRICGFLARRY